MLESRNRADVRRTLTRARPHDGRCRPRPKPPGPRSRAQTRAAAARVPPSVRGRRVYFEVDPTPYAAGPASFIGETLDRARHGQRAAGRARAVPQAQPGIRRAPAARHRHRQPSTSLADMAKRPGWSALRALRERRAAAASRAQRFELLVRPGPRMGEAAALLADCLAGLDRRAPMTPNDARRRRVLATASGVRDRAAARCRPRRRQRRLVADGALAHLDAATTACSSSARSARRERSAPG